MGIDRAHACFEARWTDRDPVIDTNHTRQNRAGYRRAETLQRKRTVHRQAKQPLLRPCAGVGCGSIEMLRQCREALPVAAETGTIGQPARPVPSRIASTSCLTAAIRSSATRSAFVERDDAALKPQQSP